MNFFKQKIIFKSRLLLKNFKKLLQAIKNYFEHTLYAQYFQPTIKIFNKKYFKNILKEMYFFKKISHPYPHTINKCE